MKVTFYLACRQSVVQWQGSMWRFFWGWRGISDYLHGCSQYRSALGARSAVFLPSTGHPWCPQQGNYQWMFDSLGDSSPPTIGPHWPPPPSICTLYAQSSTFAHSPAHWKSPNGERLGRARLIGFPLEICLSRVFIAWDRNGTRFASHILRINLMFAESALKLDLAEIPELLRSWGWVGCIDRSRDVHLNLADERILAEIKQWPLTYLIKRQSPGDCAFIIILRSPIAFLYTSIESQEVHSLQFVPRGLSSDPSSSEHFQRHPLINCVGHNIYLGFFLCIFGLSDKFNLLFGCQNQIFHDRPFLFDTGPCLHWTSF